jgi:DedD protein
MAHDLHDDGFHEIQLSGKQLVFLFMATTVVSIVIFLCGVLVGRGTPVRAAGDVAAASAVEPEAPVDPALVDPPAAPQSNEPTKVQGLSYPERLVASEPRPEVVAPAPTPAPKAEPAREGREVAKAAPPPTPAPTPAPKGPTERPGPVRATAKAEPSPAAPSSGAAAEGGFTVQVTALKNRADAEQIAERLQSRGYRAYVVAPEAGGQVIYKVRVGMNLPRPEAEQVMARLKAEEKFQPWITR